MRSEEHLEEGEGHPGNTDMETGRHRSGHGNAWGGGRGARASTGQPGSSTACTSEPLGSCLRHSDHLV